MVMLTRDARAKCTERLVLQQTGWEGPSGCLPEGLSFGQRLEGRACVCACMCVCWGWDELGRRKAHHSLAVLEEAVQIWAGRRQEGVGADRKSSQPR